MTRFVLVPGAYHGGWWYDRLVDALEADGHIPVAITLAGLEDKPQLDRLITLGTHIDQVAAAVADADQIVLVGHSYAGAVITGVADRLPQRIGALVYLDAFWPEDGDSCWNMANDEMREWYIRGCARTGYGVDPVRADNVIRLRDLDERTDAAGTFDRQSGCEYEDPTAGNTGSAAVVP